MTSPRTWFQQVINTDATAGSTCAVTTQNSEAGPHREATVTRKATLPATLTCDRPGSSDQKRTPYEH